ncbi:MAG TPA: hypothetical protein VND93_12995 [Myxococcales bacterium]|nr:hypothetical protein [Myxococcales bacterium]
MKPGSLTAVVLAAALAPAVALGQAKPGYRATFPVPQKGIPPESAGVYKGGAVILNLDSLGGNMMVPNMTGLWKVIPNTTDPTKGQMIFSDPVQPLKMHGATEVPERLEGTLTAMATVNQVFAATRAVVTVNVTGGPDGKGSVSRQGPMLRWNGSTRFITCYVDFAAGTAYQWAARNTAVYDPLGKAIPIKGFANTKPYRIEFSMIGQTGRCQVFDGKDLVADTGDIVDARTPEKGATGVLIEITPKAPEAPLEGSFSELSVTTP